MVGRSAKELPSDSANLGSLGTSGQLEGSKPQSLKLRNRAKNLIIETWSGRGQRWWSWLKQWSQMWRASGTGTRRDDVPAAVVVHLLCPSGVWSLGWSLPAFSFLRCLFLSFCLHFFPVFLRASQFVPVSARYHILVPVKASQNLVSSSLRLLLREIPEPSGSLRKGFLSLNILIKHGA